MRTSGRAFLIACCLVGLIGCTKVAMVPESGETLGNWSIARDYQAVGRYELARQHYLLALASARTADSQQALQRELQALDRMMQAVR